MSRSDLLKRFHVFLESSSKNTEQFDAELLNAITVDTRLDSIVSKAVIAGRDVVIAGTAGSGKTHLLKRLESGPDELRVVEFGQHEPAERFVRTVSDLTAVPTNEQMAIFEAPASCQLVVVAANEGALLAARRDSGPSNDPTVFAEAVELLHKIQRGNRADSEDGPVLIDAAGFDPSSNAVLEKLLNLEITHDLMESELVCECTNTSNCPRRQAWRQLRSERVRQRVSEIVSAASVNAEGFTFRSIWNFLADLMLGGVCKPPGDGVPTSTWFWRVFNGDSQVSRHISELFPEYRFTIPHAEPHLWYGDWRWFRENNRTIEGVKILAAAGAPCDKAGEEEAQLAFRWLKAQTLFLAEQNAFTSGITTTDASGLWADAIEARVAPVVRAINRYMLYGFADPGTKLSLWIDYSMEQRLSRPDGQVSLGSAGPDDFEIARSLAAANTGDAEPPTGARLFLRHKASGATLSLTREALSLIAQGRSSRTVDRENTEMDWELMNFFSQIAESAATPNELSVALFDFEKRTCQVIRWDIQAHAPSVGLSQ